MARPDFKNFKKRALERPEVEEEYERLSPAYELRRNLVALRQEAGGPQGIAIARSAEEQPGLHCWRSLPSRWRISPIQKESRKYSSLLQRASENFAVFAVRKSVSEHREQLELWT